MFVFKAVEVPYPVFNPYSACESLMSSVVHVIVAEFAVMPDDATDDITGGVVSVVPEPGPILIKYTLPV